MCRTSAVPSEWTDQSRLDEEGTCGILEILLGVLAQVVVHSWLAPRISNVQGMNGRRSVRGAADRRPNLSLTAVYRAAQIRTRRPSVAHALRIQ